MKLPGRMLIPCRNQMIPMTTMSTPTTVNTIFIGPSGTEGYSLVWRVVGIGAMAHDLRMKSIRTRIAMAGAALALTGLALSGQGPPAPKGLVVDTGALTPFVENMDRSLAFYHDVFDMTVPPLPTSGARPYNPPNPGLFAFFDIPGAKERHQSAQVTGIRTAIEAMEIQQVPFKTVALRIQD